MALKESVGKVDLTLVPMSFYEDLKPNLVLKYKTIDLLLMVHRFYCRLENDAKMIRNAIYSAYMKTVDSDTEINYEIAKVMQFGATKYKRDNWALGGKYSLILAACERHLLQYAVDPIDKESGCNHLAHALCNISFIIYYESKKKIRESCDDRTTIYLS